MRLPLKGSHLIDGGRALIHLICLVVVTACAAQPTPTPPPPTVVPTLAPTNTAAPTPTLIPFVEQDAFAQAAALGPGINFGNMLEAPHEGDWGLVLESDYFDLVKNAG